MHNKMDPVDGYCIERPAPVLPLIGRHDFWSCDYKASFPSIEKQSKIINNNICVCMLALPGANITVQPLVGWIGRRSRVLPINNNALINVAMVSGVCVCVCPREWWWCGGGLSVCVFVRVFVCVSPCVCVVLEVVSGLVGL